MLTPAGQAEIFRSSEKDERIIIKITENVNNLIKSIIGIPKWIRVRHKIEMLSSLLYQSLTTVSGLQTLGEEYTGVVQTNSSLKQLPLKTSQILMILLNTFGETVVISLLQRFENKLMEDTGLTLEARNLFLKISRLLRENSKNFIQLHKSVFFIEGKYQDFSKRTTGTRYALVRFWLKDQSMLPMFRFLGTITFIQHLLKVMTAWKSIKPEQDLKREEDCLEIPASRQCVLCLNERTKSSCTLCGHIFCWNCIITWLQENPYCPICREALEPSRVIFLQNYE